MKKRLFIRVFGIIFIVFSLQACSISPSGKTVVPSEVSIPTVDRAISTNVPTAIIPTPTPTSKPSSPTPIPTLQESIFEPGIIRQGANFGYLDGYEADDVAAGDYYPDLPDCGSPWLAPPLDSAGENVLTLNYTTPLLSDRIEIYTSDPLLDIRRVEVMNSRSGVGWAALEEEIIIREEVIQEGPCLYLFTIPLQAPVAVDTVFLEFGNEEAALTIAAVEMVGKLEAYIDPQVFWRVPIPDTPVDISMSQNGLVFVAAGKTGLYTYDVEGNQLKTFSVPVEAELTSVAADPFGNLVILDGGYGWFILLSREGEQLAVGGDNLRGQIAVNPLDGDLYILNHNEILVYTIDTVEFQRSIPLNEVRSYAGLAFSPSGKLYTIRDFSWDPTLVQLDPLSGEELDAFPLVDSMTREIIYVLFSNNTGQIAVHKLNPQGVLLTRFGLLSTEPNGWPEGTFLDPRAITVSEDGRFVLIADGYDNSAYLTALLMDIDEE
jgi:hypothetical protein